MNRNVNELNEASSVRPMFGIWKLALFKSWSRLVSGLGWVADDQFVAVTVARIEVNELLYSELVVRAN